MALWSLSAKYSAVLLTHFTAGKLRRGEGCWHPASPAPRASEHRCPSGTAFSIPTHPEGASLSSLKPGTATTQTLLALGLSPPTLARPAARFHSTPHTGADVPTASISFSKSPESSPRMLLSIGFPEIFRYSSKTVGREPDNAWRSCQDTFKPSFGLAGDAHPGGGAACFAGQGCR